VGELVDRRNQGRTRHGWQNSFTINMKEIDRFRKWFPSIQGRFQ
jgi:hypothetical protein